VLDRSVANTTRALRQTFSVARVWRLVWKARALDRLLIRCPAPNMQDIIISSAHVGVAGLATSDIVCGAAELDMKLRQ